MAPVTAIVQLPPEGDDRPDRRGDGDRALVRPRRKAHKPFVSPRLVRMVRNYYFADASRRAEPLASPLRNDEGIAALPPLLVVTAEQDSVRPQDEHFVDKARAKGVPVTYHCASGVDHGFPQSSRKQDEPAVRELAELMRVHLTENLA